MNYVTIKNGVVSPITERKQLYYKDPSIVGEFNFKSTEQDINTTKWAPGTTTNGYYDAYRINGISFPVNIVPKLNYQDVVKEYEVEYKFSFNNSVELNNQQHLIAWFTGNRTLPDKEGNFYTDRYNTIFITENKIYTTMFNKMYLLEDGTIDFNIIKNYWFRIYLNTNGKLIITTPNNKIEENDVDNRLNAIYPPFTMLLAHSYGYGGVNGKYAFGAYYETEDSFNITSLEVNFIARNKITI